MTASLALLVLLAAGFGGACALAGAAWMKMRSTPASSALARERELLAEFVDDWLWRTDADGRLRLWRPPAHHAAGWRIVAPLGRPLPEMIAAQRPGPDADTPGEGRPGHARDGASLEASGADLATPLARRMAAHTSIAGERVTLHLGGTASGWTLRGRPCFDLHGRFDGYLGTARPDVDDRSGRSAVHDAGAEDAVAVAPTPLAEQADQESFIYSVSHDLRAPIRVVEGFARILKEDYGRFLDRIGNDHADRILAAAARMNSMIDALLALSRLQSQPLKRQPVDLSQLMRYVVDDLRGQAPERRVEIEIQPGLVVRGDPTLLRVAIENLVGNAWKYTGQVEAARIAFRRDVVAGQEAFVIDDNGAGFDPRFADRLFGVFQRLHSAKDFPGTGVGLASVRRIVRRHGGDVWAESTVGAGARFYFTLPH